MTLTWDDPNATALLFGYFRSMVLEKRWRREAISHTTRGNTPTLRLVKYESIEAGIVTGTGTEI